ncbi:pseudouridine synthase [Pseudotabrizicola sp. L79]|uniref:pseudouridine synthase n=1 Tax=Pseudotabrizicola sp. L79 TaxID=3118402 RepID=UPI002F945656
MPEKTSPRKGAAAKPAAVKPDAAQTPEGDRIAKVLSRAGIASRREAERLIEAGEVKVNGKLVTSPALNVTGSDKITVSGQPVGAPEPARLWLYYKPEGLVTSASDEKGRETVFDHLPEDIPRVMSVGRLDLNSEGLLLLTNDGALKRQLELPSTGWLRKYRVRVKGNPTDPELDPLRKGITVEGERFQPMEVVLDRHQGANAWLTVGLREGKNREIRRAMSAIGVTVNRLIRISYGPFRLNDLKPGEVEEIRARVLRDQLGALIEGGEAAEGAPKAKLTRAPRKPGPAKSTDAPGFGQKRMGAADRPDHTAAKRTGPKPASRWRSDDAGAEPRARPAPAARREAAETEAPSKPRAPHKPGPSQTRNSPSRNSPTRNAGPQNAGPKDAKPGPRGPMGGPKRGR